MGPLVNKGKINIRLATLKENNIIDIIIGTRPKFQRIPWLGNVVRKAPAVAVKIAFDNDSTKSNVMLRDELT